MVLDANKLYGFAMSQPLPDNNYKCVSNNDCSDAIAALQEHASRDLWYNLEYHYLLNVYLNYLFELHVCDKINFLVPETMNIDVEITGDKQL